MAVDEVSGNRKKENWLSSRQLKVVGNAAKNLYLNLKFPFRGFESVGGGFLSENRFQRR